MISDDRFGTDGAVAKIELLQVVIAVALITDLGLNRATLLVGGHLIPHLHCVKLAAVAVAIPLIPLRKGNLDGGELYSDGL